MLKEKHQERRFVLHKCLRRVCCCKCIILPPFTFKWLLEYVTYFIFSFFWNYRQKRSLRWVIPTTIPWRKLKAVFSSKTWHQLSRSNSDLSPTREFTSSCCLGMSFINQEDECHLTQLEATQVWLTFCFWVFAVKSSFLKGLRTVQCHLLPHLIRWSPWSTTLVMRVITFPSC